MNLGTLCPQVPLCLFKALDSLLEATLQHTAIVRKLVLFSVSVCEVPITVKAGKLQCFLELESYPGQLTGLDRFLTTVGTAVLLLLPCGYTPTAENLLAIMALKGAPRYFVADNAAKVLRELWLNTLRQGQIAPCFFFHLLDSRDCFGNLCFIDREGLLRLYHFALRCLF